MSETKKKGFFQSEDWKEFRDKIMDPREVFEQMVFLFNIFYICKRKPRGDRKIYVNDSKQTAYEFGYTHNSITTAKYRWWNFFFKNIFEQFLRIANIYFAIISILQLFSGLSPTGRWGTFLPLVFFMFVTLVKDVVEDIFRVFADQKQNFSKTVALVNGTWKKINWKDIKVGMIIKTHSEEYFPADMVLLSSSEPQSLAYIETKSLDGETNLKNRNGLPLTKDFSEKDFVDFQAEIWCEQPCETIYEFKAKLVHENTTYQIEADKQLLLRGAQLRNTPVAYGVVVYTGTDTKLMQNSKRPPHKMSKIEKYTNYMILLLVLFICVITIICSVGLAIWNAFYQDPRRPNGNPHQWYYFWGPVPASFAGISAQKFFEGLVTYFILFNNFIPISLYVSMEISKVWQAIAWIRYDPKMVYEPQGGEPKFAAAKTASLVEELGQVEFIFSDKTGTLTQNKMEFLKFCVNGTSYGKGTTEIGRAAAQRRGELLEDDRPKDWSPDANGFQFYDQRITNKGFRNDKNAKEIEEFIMFLAICHTVIPEMKKKPEGEGADELIYNASSPDEGALVKAARCLGYQFNTRTHDGLTYIDPDGKEVTVKVLNVFEFNSDRKRMSVIIKNDQDEIFLYCKGADSVLWKLMGENVTHKEQTFKDLQQFAADGLRTLLCAKRSLTFEEWDKWNETYWKPAVFDLTEARAKKIADAAAMMEVDLKLVGATAIEDKLQDNVPETISTLLQAGCKVWVLTGDKQETAINIGFACAMLDNDMHKIIVNEKRRDVLKKYLLDQYNDVEGRIRSGTGQDFAVIVDGDTLDLILNWDKEFQDKIPEKGVPLRIIFLRLCLFCKSVVCCRVSPLQKAQVVLLVKNNLKGVVTLAIGDGANDVSMIQAAHIGVGISGEEGEQASRAADFSIGQFKFLSRLLLVHGRYSYRRISKLILYFFYKNATLQFCQLFYVFYNSFTGTSLFDSTILSLYNVLWTSLPIFGFAFFDKEVDPDVSHAFPELYILGQRSYYFNVSNFIMWFSNALFHGAICFFVPMYALEFGLIVDGKVPSREMIGTLIMAAVILVVAGKISIETRDWNPVFILLMFITIGIYPAFLAVYHSLAPIARGSADDTRTTLYAVANEIWDFGNHGLPWLVLLVVFFLALTKDVCWKAIVRTFNTQLYHVLQETRSDKATRDYVASVYPIDKLQAPRRRLRIPLCGEKDTDIEYAPLIKTEEIPSYGTEDGKPSELKETIIVTSPRPDTQSQKENIVDDPSTGYAFTEAEGKGHILELATSEPHKEVAPDPDTQVVVSIN